MTNDSAINFRVMETPEDKTVAENWKEVVPHDINVKIEGIDAFKDFVAVYDRKKGLSNIRIWNVKTGEKEYIKPEDEVYSMMPDSDNPEYDTDTLRISYSSLIRPVTIYDYNITTGEKTLLKQDEVLGGYNPDNYELKQLWASASDGVKIPMSVVYKKGTKKDGKNPLLLYGYGSYGYSMEPDFSSTAFSLIDRGFVFVIAHIRGGGEMGRPWYENGKFLHKKNTFTDFIACAEQLIADGYTNPDKLVIEGGSAGGLLIGAVLNIRPDLFKTAVASVPFVDVVTTMLDETIPLTAIEWEEWGNPNNKEYYDYMLSYSPYDNVEKKAYPNILITAGLNDPRVQYWEPAKWTAKLRAMKTDNHLLFLKTNMGAGHFGASGRYGRLERVAFEMAFILKTLGMDK
jgi:oligopeptidase B